MATSNQVGLFGVPPNPLGHSVGTDAAPTAPHLALVTPEAAEAFRGALIRCDVCGEPCSRDQVACRSLEVRRPDGVPFRAWVGLCRRECWAWSHAHIGRGGTA